MGIAISLKEYMDRNHVPYDLVRHEKAMTMREAAHCAGLPEDCVVKAVLLEDRRGYLLAVLPASHHLELGQVSHLLRRRVGLATEMELAGLFSDCELGAVPAVGEAYGVETLVDDSLDDQFDLYFEAGDHRNLIHVKAEDFARLLPRAKHGRISTLG